ncbi:MAG TPA: NHL repeat-containing protein, partial [Candidatus Binataceae bacterium]|nr:NHL repeat-containing protein [Candidatus Binataceae bacterium]
MKRTGRKAGIAIAGILFLLALMLSPTRRSNRAYGSGANPTIFVTDNCTKAVTAYPIDSTGDAAPAPPAPTGLSLPQAVAIDQNGLIYVANGCGGQAVVIYAKGSNGNVSPIAGIGGSNSGLIGVTGVALDSNGLIYVSGFFSSGAGVAIFPALGNSTGLLNEAPLATIGGSHTGVDIPDGVVLDSAGDIYLADSDADSISVFPPLGSSRGNLNEAPFATLKGSSTGLSFPSAIYLDANRNIYVVQEGSDTVMAFAPLSSRSGIVNEAPFITISGDLTDLSGPMGIAVDSAGRIFVAQPSAVLIFPSIGSSTGSINEAPLATISGSNTDLGEPMGIAFDSNGQIFVTDLGFSSVFVYPALGSSSGTINEAPTALISTGATTGLGNPAGIGLDSSGRIYVADFFD